MLYEKLQLKPEDTVAIMSAPFALSFNNPPATVEVADVLLFFALNYVTLARDVLVMKKAADRGASSWICYPKAGQLGTDLNRDSVRSYCESYGLETVRQVAIDGIWSALRLKPASHVTSVEEAD